MTVGSCSMSLGKLAMFVSRGCVLLGVFVLTLIVMMGRLMVMVRSGVMVSGPPDGEAHSPDASMTVPFKVLLQIRL
jgi:hypothetical protein